MEKNILSVDKLEELLIKNWTQFMNHSRFIAFCLKNIRDHQYTFSECENKIEFQKNSNFQISLSRFQLTSQGFIVWAEFKLPQDTKIAIGTIELLLNNSGEFSHIQTMGSLYNI